MADTATESADTSADAAPEDGVRVFDDKHRLLATHPATDDGRAAAIAAARDVGGYIVAAPAMTITEVGLVAAAGQAMNRIGCPGTCGKALDLFAGLDVPAGDNPAEDVMRGAGCREDPPVCVGTIAREDRMDVVTAVSVDAAPSPAPNVQLLDGAALTSTAPPPEPEHLVSAEEMGLDRWPSRPPRDLLDPAAAIDIRRVLGLHPDDPVNIVNADPPARDVAD